MKKNNRIAGHPVRYFQETDSTNARAREEARKGAESGTVFVAETQSKGRGRLGRSWHSPAGSGLYFSLILSPGISTTDLPKISLATGVALCRAIRGYVENPALKWPNDLLLEGRKVAGILTETIPRQDTASLVIMGIGINVNQCEHNVPAELADRLGTIQAAYGSPLARGKLLESILNQIDALLNQAERYGFTDILKEWRNHDASRGKYLTWLTTEGETVHGLSQGIDEEGLLWIRDNRGKMHEVISGDITIGKAG
ncbi:MAG: biotin--[acetyl-CoA-carboxylase] ligase [Desulfurivibrionaceae bacterium]